MAERATLGQWSFNGGEWSLRLHGRVDQAGYQVSVKEMLGWIPTIQGPAVAAPGTHYVEAAAGPCRLFGFEPFVTQGYAIEASNLVFRFYTNDARIETAPGVAYEVAHPYSYADLLDVDYHESIDVLYLAGGGRQQSTLSRTGAETFAWALLALRNGPIGPGNFDESVTVSASATTGSVTLTASSAIFEAGHVGGFFELQAADFNDVKSWEPGMKGVTVGTTKITWAGRTYLAVAAADAAPKTGSVPPIHDAGTEWDGQGGLDVNGKGPFGVQWQYLYNRIGLLEITAFTSTTVVTATVIKRLADSLTATPSWRWAHGAFSDAAGWPDTVAVWDESLVLTRDATGYVSVVGELDNFDRRDSAGDFQRDLAGQFTIPDPARIVWSKADRVLLLGTEKGEYAVERLQIQTGQPGPPVFAVRQQTSNGSQRIKPVQADGRMLYGQRAGRKLREMGYALASDRYSSPDLTRLADHIGAPGFVELAWQAEPERLVWTVRGDGTLAAMTYDPDQQVMGWCRRTLGPSTSSGPALLAKSICRITDPQGRRDQLWLAVQLGAEGPHWILRMHKIWETGDVQEDAVMLDAALTYSGDPATVIDGLDHLEGLSVGILADGKPHPARTVSAGAITLEYAAGKVHAGLEYPASIRTLEPEGGQSEGTAQTKKKRIVAVNLRVAEAQGLRVQVQNCQLVPVETRVSADDMDVAIPLFTGDVNVPTIGTYDSLGEIMVERWQPTPATLIAIVPALEVGDV